MMFKKITLALVALALVASLASCAKYGDLKDSMDKMGKSVEKFVADGNKAADAKAAAAAITAYGADITTNGSALSSVFKKYMEELNDPKTEFPKDVKASHEKFTKYGEQLGAVITAINTKFGTDPLVSEAYDKFYAGLKKAIAVQIDAATKFQADMTAAKDGKTAGALITSFSAASRTNQDAFVVQLPLYPEIRFIPLPQTLVQASTDMNQINAKVVAGMAAGDAYAKDADLIKALDARYNLLKGAVDKSLKATEDFVAAMEKAADAKTTASAIENFITIVKDTQKVGSAEFQLFPELQAKGIDGLPASIGDPIKKMGPLNQKAQELIKKADKFKDDEQVKKALAKLNGQA